VEVGVKDGVQVYVGVSVGVYDGVIVSEGVKVDVKVNVGVALGVSVQVGVRVGVNDGVSVAVAVGTGLGVDDGVLVAVGVLVGWNAAINLLPPKAAPAKIIRPARTTAPMPSAEGRGGSTTVGVEGGVGMAGGMSAICCVARLSASCVAGNCSAVST